MAFQKGDLFYTTNHLHIITTDYREEEVCPNEMFLLVGFNEDNELLLVSQVTGSYSEWPAYIMQPHHEIFIQLT